MPYITRDDGERFVIPSYRDTISAKSSGLLKKEVAILSANYGEYIALQRKTSTTYEIAFSTDSGYLFGECVWDYFKRPYDMIYCEAIPNTSDAYLVIVKSGTVYLDGSFPVDSIPEELIIFKTQQNNFSIYISGDVPISETPQDGKFSFDESSVSSFEILPEPIFATLPVVAAFQLQLIDVVFKSLGIGVLPIKQVSMVLVLVGLVYMGYTFITSTKQLPEAFTIVAVNPYQGFLDQLSSPDPAKEIRNVLDVLQIVFTIPGWKPQSFTYDTGFPAKLRVPVTSIGGNLQILLDWAYKNNAQVDVISSIPTVTMLVVTSKRPQPTLIFQMQAVVVTMKDRLAYILPENSVNVGPIPDRKPFKDGAITITFADISPFVLDMVAQYIQGLPLITTRFAGSLADGQMSGTITFKALGN
ncbi:MAG: hypothetical protein V4501_10990 [Pseudomonadota bacterium]